MTPKPELEAPVQTGGRLRGVLGAFLGALTGEMLWYLLILGTDLSGSWGRLVILLGVISGLFACWGYRLFQGLRSMDFARKAALASSFLACPAGMLLWVAIGRLYRRWSMGLPVTAGELVGAFSAALNAVSDRLYLVLLLLSALLAWAGVGLGMKGLIKYADSAWYADPRRVACSDRGGMLYNDPSFWLSAPDISVPETFTVGGQLSVSGETITVRPPLKKQRSFSVREVAGVILGPNDGHNVLYDRNNEVLAKFAWSRKGAVTLGHYLLQHGVPFYDLEGQYVDLVPVSAGQTPHGQKVGNGTSDDPFAPLPRKFTVRSPKWFVPFGRVVGVLGSVLFTFSALMVVNLLDDPGAAILFTLTTAAFAGLTGLGILLVLQGQNWRLEVDGEQLESFSATGKAKRFRVSDIAVASISIWTGYGRLHGPDGETLFTFMSKMENSPLLAQYLEDHAVPVREGTKRKDDSI